MDDFCDARIESVGSRANSREDSLRGESKTESGDGDNDKILPFGTANESENEQDEQSDGISINGAARESEKKGGGKERGG